MKTINRTFKSKVFKAAWTSLKNGRSNNLSEALKAAWSWAKKILVDAGVSGFSVVRETEKAICIAGQIACYVTNQVVKSNMWIPKSLISDGTIPTWFFEKKVDEAVSQHNYYGSGSTIQFELI